MLLNKLLQKKCKLITNKKIVTVYKVIIRNYHCSSQLNVCKLIHFCPYNEYISTLVLIN